MFFTTCERTAHNGFVSEAGIDLVTAMELTGHRSLAIARATTLWSRDGCD
jgi:hypothetical protein